MKKLTAYFFYLLIAGLTLFTAFAAYMITFCVRLLYYAFFSPESPDSGFGSFIDGLLILWFSIFTAFAAFYIVTNIIYGYRNLFSFLRAVKKSD